MKIIGAEYTITIVAKETIANRWLRQTLLSEFGGVTIGPVCQGFWLNDDGQEVLDAVQRVYVAIPRNSLVRLLDIVQEYANLANQECVYVVQPNGSALLIDR